MNVDWTQPYVLIFEWGLFIIGWLLIVILSMLAFLLVYAIGRAFIMTVLGKRPGPRRKTSHVSAPTRRDVYGKVRL